MIAKREWTHAQSCLLGFICLYETMRAFWVATRCFLGINETTSLRRPFISYSTPSLCSGRIKMTLTTSKCWRGQTAGELRAPTEDIQQASANHIRLECFIQQRCRPVQRRWLLGAPAATTTSRACCILAAFCTCTNLGIRASSAPLVKLLVNQVWHDSSETTSESGTAPGKLRAPRAGSQRVVHGTLHFSAVCTFVVSIILPVPAASTAHGRVSMEEKIRMEKVAAVQAKIRAPWFAASISVKNVRGRSFRSRSPARNWHNQTRCLVRMAHPQRLCCLAVARLQTNPSNFLPSRGSCHSSVIALGSDASLHLQGMDGPRAVPTTCRWLHFRDRRPARELAISGLVPGTGSVVGFSRVRECVWCRGQRQVYALHPLHYSRGLQARRGLQVLSPGTWRGRAQPRSV